MTTFERIGQIYEMVYLIHCLWTNGQLHTSSLRMSALRLEVQSPELVQHTSMVIMSRLSILYNTAINSAYDMTTRDRSSANDYEWFSDAMKLMRVRDQEFARNLDEKVGRIWM